MQKDNAAEKNQGVAMVQWKSRPQPQPEMLWWDLKRAVHECMPTNLNELKQHCKEEWAKFLHNNVRDW